MVSTEYLPTIQLAALPIIALLLSAVKLVNIRIPKILLVIAVLASTTIYYIGYTKQSVLGKRVAITRFSDDSLGGVSRIFREQLDEGLSQRKNSSIFRMRSLVHYVK
jgi:hypothetical protein